MKKNADLVSNVLMLLICVLPAILSAGPIPDTGQEKCYDDMDEIACPKYGEHFYGQDAHYTGPRSYTRLDAQGNDLPDDAVAWTMVRDNVTGLIWEVKGNADGIADYGNPNDGDNTYGWYDPDPATNGGAPGAPDGTDTEDFIDSLNILNFGGQNDWRIPTISELATLIDAGRINPAMDTAFPAHAKASFYWSGTSYAINPNGAWGIHFYDGKSSSDFKYHGNYVRAVRGGQLAATIPLVINGDGTVTDPETGLMWMLLEEGPMTWQDSLASCENLNFAGFDDWRLPDLNELRSLVDYSNYFPSISPVFPDTRLSFYWSGTTNPGHKSYAWGVDFGYGNSKHNPKYDMGYVLSVRGGHAGSPGRATRWNIGETMPVSWDTSVFTGNVALSISRDGGKTFENIVTSGNNGSCNWIVTGAETVNGMLKIAETADPSRKTLQGLITIGDVPESTGNLNYDLYADLADLIIALRIVSGMDPGVPIALGSDVNGDGNIGIAEAVYILQKVSGMREVDAVPVDPAEGN